MTWRIRIDHSDKPVSIDWEVPDDELEYGIDDALREARALESNPAT
jgi:hypothetical protein